MAFRRCLMHVIPSQQNINHLSNILTNNGYKCPKAKIVFFISAIIENLLQHSIKIRITIKTYIHLQHYCTKPIENVSLKISFCMQISIDIHIDST